MDSLSEDTLPSTPLCTGENTEAQKVEALWFSSLKCNAFSFPFAFSLPSPSVSG